jgi:ribose/xylose/arabinose/galactoside ABC-type transport system permease subunit
MAAPDRTRAVSAADLLPHLRTLGWRELLEAREAAIVVVLIALATTMSIAYPQFRTLGNVDNILQAVAQTAIVGVGMTMVIVTGGIDVSVGSALSVCAVVVGQRLQDGAGVVEAIAVALAVGTAIGLVNGLLIGLGRVHAIIVTFGMLNILRVVSFKATGGNWLSGVPDRLSYFGNGTLLKLPFAWWIAMAVGAVATYYLRRRPTGRHLYALGGNPETARLAGVGVLKRTIFVYTITGTLVGVAAIVFVGGATVIQTNVGVGFELDVIAAVVIGGTSILGGKGTVFGTLLGALLVGTIENALVVVNIDALYTGVILGGLIVLTVSLDLLRRRRRQE